MPVEEKPEGPDDIVAERLSFDDIIQQAVLEQELRRAGSPWAAFP